MKRNREKTKENKGNSKGFNLFTPLVGTSVIIISILISITMIQNSINISEGVSKSYTSSQQVTGSQLIETSASVQIMDNVEKTLAETLGGVGVEDREIKITCEENAGNIDCHSRLEEKFNGWPVFKRRLSTQIYRGIVDRFREMGYDIEIHKPCDHFNISEEEQKIPSKCIDLATRRSQEEELSDVNYNKEEGKFQTTIYPSQLKYQESFHLKFTKENTTISHKVIPGEVTVTSRSIKNQIKATEKALEAIKDEVESRKNEGEDPADLEPGEFCFNVTQKINQYAFIEEHEPPTIWLGAQGTASIQIEWLNTQKREESMKLHFTEGEQISPIGNTCN